MNNVTQRARPHVYAHTDEQLRALVEDRMLSTVKCLDYARTRLIPRVRANEPSFDNPDRSALDELEELLDTLAFTTDYEREVLMRQVFADYPAHQSYPRQWSKP